MCPHRNCFITKFTAKKKKKSQRTHFVSPNCPDQLLHLDKAGKGHMGMTFKLWP